MFTVELIVNKFINHYLKKYSSFCRSHENKVICDCPLNMDLNNDMKTCVEIDPCHKSSNKCSHFCDSNREPICYCPENYKLDEDDGHTCKENVKCEKGFHLHDQKCDDIDECLEENICLNGKCENNEGSFICSCDTGYELELNNHTCLDIDECIQFVNGNCSHKCINYPGSYTCRLLTFNIGSNSFCIKYL